MTGRPQCLMRRRNFSHRLIGRPDRMPGRLGGASMAADTLSDVLKTVRLTGATFFDVVARAPWVAEQPPRETILPKVLPGAEHLISYHVVTEGVAMQALLAQSRLSLKQAMWWSSQKATRMSCRAVPGCAQIEPH